MAGLSSTLLSIQADNLDFCYFIGYFNMYKNAKLTGRMGGLIKASNMRKSLTKEEISAYYRKMSLKRFAGKTTEEIKQIMSQVSKGLKIS